MVKEIQAHEERHRKIIENAATAALADAQKFVGTGRSTRAKTALTKTLKCTTNKGHEALDGTEGKLTVSEVQPAERQDHAHADEVGLGREVPLP